METSADFEEHYSELLRVAGRAAARIVDRGQAEDIAAEGRGAWLHWDALDVTAATRWVVRVATNLAIDVVRRPIPTTLVSAATPREADDEFVTREMVLAAIDLLPPRQRDAVVLRHLEGMSQLEIAAELGVARATAAVHVSRGEAALRACLVDLAPANRRLHMKVGTIEEAVDAMASETVLEARVEAGEQHGLRVDIGIPAFMPTRFVDVRPVDDLAEFVGRTVDCTVRSVSVDKGLVFVSRMHAIESGDDRARRQAWFSGLRTGDRLPGTVTAAVSFGWFVELACGTGLVHTSEAGAEALVVGQRLHVEVIAIDVAAERLSLRPSSHS